MPYYSFRNLKLFHQIRENHPRVLLFIHGLGGNGDAWKYQIEHFKDRYQIVTVDLFGQGQSSRDVDPVFAPRLDAEAIDALMREIIARPYTVIGHSFAGMIMPEMIKMGDPNLKGVIFVDCTFAGSEEIIRARVDFGNRMLALSDSALPAETDKWYRGIIGPTSNPSDIEFICSSLKFCSPRWLFESVAGCRAYVTAHPPQATPIRPELPIYVIEGDNGIGADPAKSWRGHFKKARHILLENTWHFPFVTEKEHFNSLLDSFLAENFPPRPDRG